ncbi:MAG TPA: RNA-binding protein [Patescibacteria group bacterium]|nr:RNA-binding protein [Patescibacteria group bacterium]
MGTRLYVGGLPYSSTEDDVRAAFAQAGAVSSVKIISDKFSGRSRGFGFVDMETPDAAQKAIDLWNGKEFEGRKLIVSEARPLEDRGPRA